MSVKWLVPAHEDMLGLIDWYSQNSPENLPEVAQAIWDAAQSLTRFPNRGRPGFVEGTRELLVPRLPYMLVYKVLKHDIAILRLLHQHQNWP